MVVMESRVAFHSHFVERFNCICSASLNNVEVQTLLYILTHSNIIVIITTLSVQYNENLIYMLYSDRLV